MWIQPAPLPLPRELQHLWLRPGWWVFGRRAWRRLSALYLSQAGGSEMLLVPAGHGLTPVVARVPRGAAEGWEQGPAPALGEKGLSLVLPNRVRAVLREKGGGCMQRPALPCGLPKLLAVHFRAY